MAISAGASVSASNFNALFTRLNTIRTNHLNKDGQNTTANTSLRTAFSTRVAVAGNNPVPSNVQQIKNNLTTLADSEWLDTTFASRITIPTAGTLLRASDFNVFDRTITAVEAVCPNYSRYSRYSNYSNYRNYTNYTNYSRYSRGCFLEGTEILLSDGTKKPIEQIVSGDELLVYDEHTNSLQKAFNFHTKKYTTDKLITILLENGDSVKTTVNHPLLTTEGWACLEPDSAEKEHGIKPILLQDNMKIITASGESQIKEITQEEGTFNVYNIEVPYYHTYFANNMVAHNAYSRT